MQFVPSEAKIEENSNAVKSMDKVEIVSEEVNGTSEYNDKDDHDNHHKDEHNSPLHCNPKEEEDDEDEDEEDNPGEASVPRKLWKFFTS